jgi:hypothetical protein
VESYTSSSEHNCSSGGEVKNLMVLWEIHVRGVVISHLQFQLVFS